MTDKPIPDDEIEAVARVICVDDGSRFDEWKGYRNRAEAAIRALDAVRAGNADAGWQPIETAPKDGTPILLIISGRELHVDEDTPCGIGRWKPDFWGENNWCMDSGDFWPGATHWMPLPTPPKG